MPKNLTHGSVLRTIIVFSLPYLLSYFLQTLYGMADLFIAGQFNGAEVISAVAIGSQLMHMLTVILVGLAMGTTVMIGRAVGAHDDKKAAKAIGNSVALFVAVALVATVVLVACSSLLVRLMATPAEAVAQTRLYITICFIGIPFITAYNVFAAIYRGLGDAKSPLYFVAIACVVNIVLDYVFIGVCKLQAGGAALATVLSQAFSATISFASWKRSRSSLRLQATDFRPEKPMLASLLKIGVPISCQDGFIQISFLLITIIANRRGVAVAAAVGIVEKIISFLFLVPSSMLSSISAIAAQNMGAGEHRRAQQTLLYGAGLATAIGGLFALLFQYVSQSTVALFVKDAAVVTLGTQYLKSYVFDCVFAAVHFSFSGFFCAYGYSIVSFIHNVASIILIRVPGAWFASLYYPETLYPMGWAAPLGSLLSSVICVAAYCGLRRRGKLGTTEKRSLASAP